jgi:hypothetical protein
VHEIETERKYLVTTLLFLYLAQTKNRKKEKPGDQQYLVAIFV